MYLVLLKADGVRVKQDQIVNFAGSKYTLFNIMREQHSILKRAGLKNGLMGCSLGSYLKGCTSLNEKFHKIFTGLQVNDSIELISDLTISMPSSLIGYSSFVKEVIENSLSISVKIVEKDNRIMLIGG